MVGVVSQPMVDEQRYEVQHVRHQVVFNVVKSFTSKNLKIARETLNIEPSEEEGGRPHEWRRLVGSIRRRVQRHASTSGSQETPTSTATTTTGPTSPQQSISRKNSLTQSSYRPELEFNFGHTDICVASVIIFYYTLGDAVMLCSSRRFDFFKKSKDESSKSSAEKNQKPLTRQKSVEQNPTPKVQDYFKALTSKDKSKSMSVKSVHNLASPTSSFNLRGLRKNDKILSSSSSPGGDAKTAKVSFSQKKMNKRDERNANRDDFLKATMRIFLVVSPPVGKIQGDPVGYDSRSDVTGELIMKTRSIQYKCVLSCETLKLGVNKTLS
ncbi:hypothetical protein QE152_g25292 [Popillia japonica]|uniref:Uncharacterized protein n=1 Tax=Popillia japonica TaxID=7064 RepID=A0AAW1K178_POPJA